MMRVLKWLFTWCLRGTIALAVLLLLFLWVVTFLGRGNLTPAGWIAVLITLLPYLYVGLFVFFLFLLMLARKKMLLIPLFSLIVSFFFLWGGSWLPQKSIPAPQIDPVKVMVWNVERMGEFSAGPQAIAQQVKCVADLITQEQPELFALLEVTYNQLLALQKQLNIPNDHCLWSDYYGTGQQKFGGLATCIFSQKTPLTINRRRDLSLPPNWKYLFIEVLDPQKTLTPPINFLALHIAPPEIPPEAVRRIISDIFKGKKQGVEHALKLLQNYEEQVKLQGAQAVNALQAIARFHDPTIIVGDFNSTQDAALHIQFRKTLIDTWATAGWGFGATRYWGNFLPLRIDYIYTTQNFSVQDSQTLSCNCSDHLPVISSVFLTPEGTQPMEID